jgi:hypothetical protein
MRFSGSLIRRKVELSAVEDEAGRCRNCLVVANLG